MGVFFDHFIFLRLYIKIIVNFTIIITIVLLSLSNAGQCTQSVVYSKIIYEGD